MLHNISRIEPSENLLSLFLAHPSQREEACKILFRSYLNNSEHAACKDGVFQNNILLHVWPHLELDLHDNLGVVAQAGSPQLFLGTDILNIVFKGSIKGQDIFNKVEAIMLDTCAIALTGQSVLGMVQPSGPPDGVDSTSELSPHDRLNDLCWAIQSAPTKDSFYSAQWAQLKLKIGSPTNPSRHASTIDHLLSVHDQVQTDPSLALGKTFQQLNETDVGIIFEEFVLQNVCENIERVGIAQGHLDLFKTAKEQKNTLDMKWVAKVITKAVEGDADHAYTADQKIFIANVFSNYENAVRPATLKHLNNEVIAYGNLSSNTPQHQLAGLMALVLKLMIRYDQKLEQELVDSIKCVEPKPALDEFSSFKKSKLSPTSSPADFSDLTASMMELLCKLPIVFNQCIQKGLLSAEDLRAVDRPLLEGWVGKSSFSKAPAMYQEAVKKNCAQALEAIDLAHSNQVAPSPPSNVVRFIPK